jgi:hypothetical protein
VMQLLLEGLVGFEFEAQGTLRGSRG